MKAQWFTCLLMLVFVTAETDEDRTEEYLQNFEEICNGKDEMTLQDAKDYGKKLGVMETRAEEWFDAMDTNGDKEVSSDEFLARMEVQYTEQNHDRLFDDHDRDQNCYWSREEYISSKGGNVEPNEFQEVDTDGDGKLSFEEFKATFD